MIRRATKNDLGAVNALLRQVLTVHANIRPDIFVPGTKKYTDEELLDIFADDKTPVFVYDDEQDGVLGYAFCIMKEIKGIPNLYDSKEIYIDDICVDEAHRGKHVATKLYEFVVQFARSKNCNRITLNVWTGNDGARSFYEKMGMKPLKTVMETTINQ